MKDEIECVRKALTSVSVPQDLANPRPPCPHAWFWCVSLWWLNFTSQGHSVSSYASKFCDDDRLHRNFVHDHLVNPFVAIPVPCLPSSVQLSLLERLSSKYHIVKTCTTSLNLQSARLRLPSWARLLRLSPPEALVLCQRSYKTDFRDSLLQA